MPTNSNIMSTAILRACWQEEDETGREAACPWLAWFLTRVVGMTAIPTRESDRSQASKKQWLSGRKEQGLKIEPETAEKCIGRIYFARSPGSDVWVSFYDLPKAARDRLWARMDAEAEQAVAGNDGLPF